MSRPLPENIDYLEALEPPATAPGYLVEAVIGGRMYHWSTRGVVNWNAYNWEPVGLEVVGVSEASAQVKLPNHDNAWAALILGPDVREAQVTIWQIYGGAEAGTASLPVLFQGVVDQTEIDDVVILQCVRDAGSAAMTPRLSLALWIGDAAPPPGTKIYWDNQVLTLGASDSV